MNSICHVVGNPPKQPIKFCKLVKVLHQCVPHGPRKMEEGSLWNTHCGTPEWGRVPESLQTCFESGVRRFRLAVDMVREMFIPENWRLLLPKMLDSILLGGCEIKQHYFHFWVTGGHTVGTSTLFLSATPPNLHLPTLNRHMKTVLQISWEGGIWH